jgi:hypothetical protein
MNPSFSIGIMAVGLVVFGIGVAGFVSFGMTFISALPSDYANATPAVVAQASQQVGSSLQYAQVGIAGLAVMLVGAGLSLLDRPQVI